MTVQRMVCSECAPRKMKAAQLIYRRVPGKDGVEHCAFCHEIRFCKCWEIRIGRERHE